MTKLKIGVFGIAGCAGCLLTIAFQETLLEISKLVDIKSFPLIKEDNYKGKYDVIFLEGTVTFNDDVSTLKQLRNRTKTLVALGTCSSLGGVPTIKNFLDKNKVMNLVYPKIDHLKSVNPEPIDKYVKVDYYLPQCPPNPNEVLEFIKTIASGNKWHPYEDPVCLECRKNQNLCLLEINKPCLGPITNGGCNSLCPNNKVECYGCRGPNKDLNLQAYIELLRSKGFNLEAIEKRMQIFSGLKFKEEQDKISKWLE